MDHGIQEALSKCKSLLHCTLEPSLSELACVILYCDLCKSSKTVQAKESGLGCGGSRACTPTFQHITESLGTSVSITVKWE